VSEGQYDIGMTGITIKDERKEQVDFSRPLHAVGNADDRARRRGAVHRCRVSFAAIPELLMSAQPGTSPFYAAVYNILDGNEENPRVIKFETFGAGLEALKAGDVDLTLSDSTAANGYVAASNGGLKIVGAPLASEDFGFIFPKGSDLGGADQRGDCQHEGGRHAGCAEPEVVRRLQDGRIRTAPGGSAPGIAA
jgi:polar amino acid transport system substrate-binding protein